MIGMACMIGALAFFGTSCKKNNETKNVQASLPVVETASVNDSRAYIDYFDGNKMKWSAGDQIMVYNMNEADYTQTEAIVYGISSGIGSTVANFYSADQAFGPKQTAYYCFYPASKVMNHELTEGNHQIFDVPATQNYNVDCMDPTSLVMACKGDGIVNGNFMLQHIFGFINLRLKGTGTVTSIDVIDNQFHLSGNVEADIPGINAGTLSNLVAKCSDYTQDFDAYMGELRTYLQSINYASAPNSDKKMTLECGSVALNSGDFTNFIVSLRPGALCQGFQVVVHFSDREDLVVNKYNPNAAEWAFSAPEYAQYPRGFCVKPGFLMNYAITF